MYVKNEIFIIKSNLNKKNVTPYFVDSVSAGFPSPATDYLEKANGSSMVDAGILSGDLLIVDRSVTPRNESIVIASIFGDLTVKKIRKQNTSLFLVSANSDYPSIEVKEEMECFIWGVVTYVIHKAIIS